MRYLKSIFKQRTSKYWKNELMYTLLTIILMVMTFGVCECIKINGIMSVFVKCLICVIFQIYFGLYALLS